MNAPEAHEIGHKLWISQMGKRAARVLFYSASLLLASLLFATWLFSNNSNSNVQLQVRPRNLSSGNVTTVGTGNDRHPYCVAGSKYRMCGRDATDKYYYRSVVFNSTDSTGASGRFTDGGMFAYSVLQRCELECDGPSCSETPGMNQDGYNKELFVVSGGVVRSNEASRSVPPEEDTKPPRYYIMPRIAFFWKMGHITSWQVQMLIFNQVSVQHSSPC